jgi:hypothetical protein
MELTIFYRTDEGFEWLEETYSLINKENYKAYIDDYIKERKRTAESLLEKWALNGEETSFMIDFKLKGNKESTKELTDMHTEIDNYIEDNYTYENYI